MKYTHERGKQAEEALLFFLMGLFLVGFAYYNRAWFREVLTGPVEVSPAELSKAKTLGSLPHRYVLLPVAAYYDPGVSHFKVKGTFHDRYVDYVLIRVEDHWLIAALPPGYRPPKVVGYLDVWEESDRKSEALPAVTSKIPAKYAGRLLPFHLDANQEHVTVARILLFSSVGLSALSFLVAGFYLWKLFAKARSSDPLLLTAPGDAPAGIARAGEEWRWR